MHKELENIKNKIDYIYQDTQNYFAIQHKSLFDLLDDAFSIGDFFPDDGFFPDRDSSSGNNSTSASSIEADIRSQIGDDLIAQARARVESDIRRGNTKKSESLLLTPANIQRPEGVRNISITPRYEATIFLVPGESDVYSYNGFVFIKYDATLSDTLETISDIIEISF